MPGYVTVEVKQNRRNTELSPQIGGAFLFSTPTSLARREPDPQQDRGERARQPCICLDEADLAHVWNLKRTFIMNTRLLAIALVIAFLSTGVLHARDKTDVMVMTNGDRLTCEV